MGMGRGLEEVLGEARERHGRRRGGGGRGESREWTSNFSSWIGDLPNGGYAI